ncbi:uncharacterized protein LOC132043752, partial [Lycium ferocissimum]|uniref:uncharacterized protein LOC132043752 n=1 Tax=Lycium ferocissimum TaxID=112874 RepID=UPI0028152EE4
MAPYEALYEWRCRSPIGWFDVGENQLAGLDLIEQAVDKVKVIQERLLAAQSRQKSYADNRCRKLEFEVGDWVLLMVSPMKGMIRFGKKGVPSRVVPVDDIQVIEQLSYEKIPMAILDRQ